MTKGGATYRPYMFDDHVILICGSGASGRGREMGKQNDEPAILLLIRIQKRELRLQTQDMTLALLFY